MTQVIHRNEVNEMSVYKCPNQKCKSKKFSGSYSVMLDVDDDGNIDPSSLDIQTALIDSDSAFVCGECGHSDTESTFSI